MFSYQDIFKEKQKILFVTAHPDDTVVYFGALIHQLRKDKKDVWVVVVTNGARGSRQTQITEEELAQQRLREEKDALSILGVDEQNLFCLNYKDGEVESTLKLIGEISYFIRKFTVDVVATHEPTIMYGQTYSKDGYFVQHRDHRKVGEAVMDATYPFSRDRSFFRQHYQEGIEPHAVYNLLLTDEKDCNMNLDYTDDLEIKRAAYRAHKSQFDNEQHIQEWLDSVKFDGRYLEKFHYVKLLW